MRKLFYLVLLFSFGCSSLVELTDNTIKNQYFAEFLKSPSKERSVIELEEKSQLTEHKLLNDKIVLKLNRIESNIENQEFKNTYDLIIKYILESVKAKNQNIIFLNTDNQESLEFTHFLEIKIQNEGSIVFHIQRKDQDQINYDFEYAGITITKPDIDVVQIAKPSGNIILPLKSYFVSLDQDKLNEFIKNFDLIGKGSLNVLSSSSSNVIIKKFSNNKESVVYQGSTPIRLQLFEGKYKIESYKRGNPTNITEIILNEKNSKNVFIKWKDEETTSNLNIYSNQPLSVLVDDDFKGSLPIFISELYQNDYQVELLYKQENDWLTLYKDKIFLPLNETLNLFYPMEYYENFQESFFKNAKQLFWFINPQSKIEINQEGLIVKENQEIQTPDILLDNLRGEAIYQCQSCVVTFYLDKQRIVIKKHDQWVSIYDGVDLLKLYKVYEFSNNHHYLYFDFNNETKNLSIYLNSQKIYNKVMDAKTVTIGFNHLILKEFWLSEKEYKNNFIKPFYFLGKNLNYMFRGEYKIK
jgi:hypothetical protein